MLLIPFVPSATSKKGIIVHFNDFWREGTHGMHCTSTHRFHQSLKDYSIVELTCFYMDGPFGSSDVMVFRSPGSVAILGNHVSSSECCWHIFRSPKLPCERARCPRPSLYARLAFWPTIDLMFLVLLCAFVLFRTTELFD